MVVSRRDYEKLSPVKIAPVTTRSALSIVHLSIVQYPTLERSRLSYQSMLYTLNSLRFASKT